MAAQPKPVLVSELTHILKQRIVGWEYLPGHRFTEEEICREFGVSRSPVRETLRILEEHGLVHRVPYRGCTVKQPDVRTINELYDVRTILELDIVRRLATHGLADDILNRLSRTWSQLAAVAAFDDVRHVDLAYEDRAFHETLARAAGNTTLAELLSTLNDRLHFMRMFDITTIERLRETCRQHLLILELLGAGDAAGVQAAMATNIEGARRQVERAITEALGRAYLAQTGR